MKKIFLIDDDSEDKLLFEEALGEVAPGWTCVSAENGRVALKKLHTLENETPDLIFLDVNMPLSDGWTCLKNIKSEPALSDIPVIMYSTSSQQEDLQKALNLGAVYFFTKPSDYRDLKKGLAFIVKHASNNTLANLVDMPPVFAGYSP